MPEPLTITLSSELAEKVRLQAVAHGYASESQYVEEQMAEAVIADPELESWLAAVGVARYDAYDANPEDVLTMSQFRDAITARRKAR
jgi:hypothetical protein